MKAAITITPIAQDYVNSILASNPGTALLVGYDNKGCSGHKYTFELIPADTHVANDAVELENGRVVIETKSLMGLIGSTLDLHVTQFEQQLIWDNPMAVNQCGCGESFQLEGQGSCAR